MSFTLISKHLCFEGTVAYYTHYSHTCQSEMRFSVFIPPQAKKQKVPVLYYLSGLTCTEENFTVKAGAQKYAAQCGIMLVTPDTSPRRTGIPDEDKDWDLGSGASFYLDAIVEPWQKHYQMYSYIVKELPQVIAAYFRVMTDRQGIFGHSMGGHGALVCALRNPHLYLSVSAFAPICAPTQCSLGQKAFSAYLGEDRELWKSYDASELVKTQQLNFPILIDRGTVDSFYLDKQLLPEIFAENCQQVNQPLEIRLHEGYDHGYFTISTFMEDHIKHHAQALLSQS
jgi:S-formylglutathione hydrolase